MTNKISEAVAFLRCFHGAHDDWADEIERLQAQLKSRDLYDGYSRGELLQTLTDLRTENERLRAERSAPSLEPTDRCLAAGCSEPPLRAAFCEKHNARVPVNEPSAKVGPIQRVCHALTENCVMFTDPERVACTAENCAAVRASEQRT